MAGRSSGPFAGVIAVRGSLSHRVDWGPPRPPTYAPARLGLRWTAVIAYIYVIKPSAAVHEDFSREEEAEGRSLADGQDGLRACGNLIEDWSSAARTQDWCR